MSQLHIPIDRIPVELLVMTLRIEAIVAYAGASSSTTPTPHPPPPQHRDPRLAKYDQCQSNSRFAVDSLPVKAHDGAAKKSPFTLHRYTPEEAEACHREYQLCRHWVVIA
jgi:hypothetical protein